MKMSSNPIVAKPRKLRKYQVRQKGVWNVYTRMRGTTSVQLSERANAASSLFSVDSPNIKTVCRHRHIDSRQIV